MGVREGGGGEDFEGGCVGGRKGGDLDGIMSGGHWEGGFLIVIALRSGSDRIFIFAVRVSSRWSISSVLKWLDLYYRADFSFCMLLSSNFMCSMGKTIWFISAQFLLDRF